MRTTIALFFLSLAMLTWVPEASSRPMHTPWEDVLEGSTRIALVKSHGPADESVAATEASEFRLEVIESLRGDVADGEWIVGRSEHGTPGCADVCIAFVDAENRWNFAATPGDASAPVEATRWQVTGFYDWNAHLVSPSLFTWAQLDAHIAGDKVPKSRFAGALHFLDASGAVVASDLTVTVTVSGEQAKVSGLPTLAGLSKDSLSVNVSPGWDPDVTVHWGYNLDRRLELAGMIEGVADDAFATRFVVKEPMLLTRELFDAYVADDATSGVVARLVVTLDDGATVRFAWSDGTGGKRDPIVAEGTELGSGLVNRGIAYAPEREIRFGSDARTLTIVVAEPSDGTDWLSERGAVSRYLQELLVHGGLDVALTESEDGAEMRGGSGRLTIEALELAPDAASLNAGE